MTNPARILYLHLNYFLVQKYVFVHIFGTWSLLSKNPAERTAGHGSNTPVHRGVEECSDGTVMRRGPA